MEKICIKRKCAHFALIALCVALIFVSAAFTLGAAAVSIPTGEGRTFTAEDELALECDLPVIPKTYEAWILAPTGTSRTGAIFSNDTTNFGNAGAPTVSFEIQAGGKPVLYMVDSEGNQMKKAFDYDVRGTEYVHLAITHARKDDGGSVFTLYVNGELIGTTESKYSNKLDRHRYVAL